MGGTTELLDAQDLDPIIPASEIVQLVLIRRPPAQVLCLERLYHLDLSYSTDLEEAIELGLDKNLIIAAVHTGMLTLEQLAHRSWCADLASHGDLEEILSDRETIMAAMRLNGMDLRYV